MDLSKARLIFFEEAYELCDAFETALLDPDTYPPCTETYNLIFRTAHTIKGSAGIFGLEALVKFAHVVENVLERLRSDQLTLTDELVNLLLASNDHLRRLLLTSAASELQSLVDLPEGIPLLANLEQYQTTQLIVAAAPDTAAAVDTIDDYSPLAATSLWHLSLRFHPNTFRDGFDPLSFLRYLQDICSIKNIDMVWRDWPLIRTFDPTECFMGFEISMESDASYDKISGTFDFVIDDSLIGILPPHSSLATFRTLAQQLCEQRNEEIAEQLERWCRHHILTRDEAIQVENGQFTAIESSPSPNDIASFADTAAANANASKPKIVRAENQSIRIETAKLDRLINRVGELVIASSGTKLIAQHRGDAELIESVAIINALVESIRDDALTLRMVPVDEIFSRFPRMVREVSKQLNKNIHLEIKGAETEVDKSMVEKLTDPLMHIIRNAVDHGLESAEQRLAANKPEVGTVTLNAYHDAGSVVVEIKDDGAGINREKVLAKAIERGLINEDRQLSDQETLQLIFLPGFSTADTVSDISGRGVGMDVVKRNIESLRGEIEIYSRPGEGSTFRLRLPLTLAIIDGFHVEVGDSALVMPLDMMIECVDMPPETMNHNTRQVNLRGDWLPFISLRELFDLPIKTQPEFIVIVHYGENRAGIVVDRLIGELQAVIKPLGDIFKSLRGISGSTILGNGKPALVLDIPQLIQHAWRRERRLIRQHTEAIAKEKQHPNA
ncbi:chemotaxis protein CheA [Iodobacter sp. LRB]|uniref:chemotaxis protein CheA n=1 Tax=unclassified Iodobacter TaxID=235634 RepID=UPI000C103C36|nr:chemotaxis protein CheA [Iodobacter sp. BJB302]PHV03543.1 chemotaxis protein CheA [Iodobacter sp. BJB302]